MKNSVALLVAALGLAGCAAEKGPTPPRIGEAAPPLAAPTLDGDTVRLADLRGRPVLLNLWATWCAPCRHETPFLESLYEDRRDQGLEVVGVSMDTGDQAGAVRSFVEEYGVTYTILHDRQMRAMDTYQVLGLPATFLLDREGVLRWMRYGPVSETDADFMQAMDEVLR